MSVYIACPNCRHAYNIDTVQAWPGTPVTIVCGICKYRIDFSAPGRIVRIMGKVMPVIRKGRGQPQ